MIIVGNTMKYFTDWLNDSVIYKKQLSQSGAGDIVYASDGITLACYISGQTVKTVNDKGEEIISNQQIYLDYLTTGVSTIDFAQFTGIIEIESRDRPIKAIDRFKDEDGNTDLVVVYL